MEVILVILEFKGEYAFLSNFYPSTFILDGKIYPTVEHYFQAQKTTNKNASFIITKLFIFPIHQPFKSLT